MCIRFKNQVNAFRGVRQIEGSSASETTGTECSVVSLTAAAACHVELVSNNTMIDISDPDMESQHRLPNSKATQEEAASRATTVNQCKFTFNQPARARAFIGFQNTRRSQALQGFLQV